VDTARIEDLKRRIQRDPASIAFAQLGEEYRRAARFREAIDVCRAGLRQHPGYLSARVTLGRALIEVNDLDQSARELEEVLALASENLAALRGLADIAQRRNDPAQALFYLRQAADLAPQDVELQRSLAAIRQPHAEQPATDLVAAVPLAPVDEPPVAVDEPPPLADEPLADVPLPAHEVATIPPVPDRHAERVTAALERWHAAIVADRAGQK
jgi:tetratricopeptide (TPR) repeat protein